MRERRIHVHHFGFRPQALARIECGFADDLEDAAAMLREASWGRSA